MPQKFDQCVADGGKVRTITGPDKKFGLGGNQYRHVCIITRKGKKEFNLGEVKTKK